MSAAMDRDRERARLERLRFMADAMRGDRWIVDVDGGEVRLVAARATGDDALICTIHAAALPVERDLICGALGDLAMFLALFARAADTVRDLNARLGGQEAERRRKDYAAQAAMLLADRRFQRFLDGKGAGAPVTDAATADTRLKFLLGVASKKEFNTDERARAAWLRLMGEFEAWKRGGLA